MNIYTGNLSYNITEEELAQAFAEFGEVNSATIINDKFSGRSKGFGFVEMPNNSEAENAIKSINGTSVKGRDIVVNEARPRTENKR